MRGRNIRIKKGQVAMEFVVLVGIAFFTFLTFLVIILYHTEQLRNQKYDEMLVDVSLMVQSEINSASIVKDGYTRYFTIPTTLDGKSYTISKKAKDNLITLSFYTEKQSTFVVVPEYEGNLNKGENKITKIDGRIYVNEE